jgi:hypothetical protein
MLRILLCPDGTFETQYKPLNEIKTNKITISKTPIDSREKLLYHKTTYRPWYDEAMEKIKSKGLKVVKQNVEKAKTIRKLEMKMREALYNQETNYYIKKRKEEIKKK